jgi:hypothetical protein
VLDARREWLGHPFGPHGVHVRFEADRTGVRRAARQPHDDVVAASMNGLPLDLEAECGEVAFDIRCDPLLAIGRDERRQISALRVDARQAAKRGQKLDDLVLARHGQSSRRSLLDPRRRVQPARWQGGARRSVPSCGVPVV